MWPRSLLPTSETKCFFGYRSGSTLEQKQQFEGQKENCMNRISRQRNSLMPINIFNVKQQKLQKYVPDPGGPGWDASRGPSRSFDH